MENLSRCSLYLRPRTELRKVVGVPLYKIWIPCTYVLEIYIYIFVSKLNCFIYYILFSKEIILNAVNILMLFSFFWVTPQSLNFVLTFRNTLSHLHRYTAYDDGAEVFTDVGELPKRKNTTFRTQRKFVISNKVCLY